MKENTEVEEFDQINVDKPAVADPVLPAVGPNESGFGHPYAPQNWPNPGDNWRWKVGSRVSKLGHHVDRYLYAPKRLPQPRAFASKKSLERYIRKEFPDTDVDGFFTMFSWNIPAKEPVSVSSISDPKASSSFNSPRDMKGNSMSGSQSTECPAGRKSCKGLFLEAEKPTMPCDICCAQPDFCRHCSCILCSKTVKSSFGYSYFRCEKVVNEAFICGHVAHLNCALQCNLAGTVGGVFKLDAAYYCRRCDARSDLIQHATNLLEMCKSINSSNDLEKILKLGIGILRGSEREPAKVLLRSIETAFDKLTNGSPLISEWEAGENVCTVPSSMLSNAVDVNAQTTNRDSLGTVGQNTAAANSPDAQEIDPQKIEDEIYNTLQSLKKSQEAEYQQAREKLNTQKTYLINLQEQLQHEKAQLDDLPSSRDRNASLDIVVGRTEQIRKELKKLKEMQDAYKKFRNVS